MPTPGTNEIFENILENQNAYIRSGETARTSLDTKVTNAMRQLDNDDTALSQINTKVTNAISQLVNDDTALSQIDTKVTNAMSQLDNDDSALTDIKDDVTSALTALNTLAQRQYGYTHEAIVTDDLEKDYQNIITANSDLADVSAVGMLAILNDGDTVTAQGNRLFINGTESKDDENTPKDYTFSGVNSQNGIELVKIWYFNNSTLNLDKPDFKVISVNKKSGTGTISLPNDFYDYVDYVEYNGTLNGAVLCIKKQINNSNVNFSDTVFSPQLNGYESNCENMPANTGPHNLTMLQSIKFPELKSIGVGNDLSGFTGCTNLTEMYFPKLESIAGMTTTYPPRAPFYHVDTVTIPESVKEIGKWAFVGNKKVVLNCKEATDIKDDAFHPQEPPNEFAMCSEWEATMNIATAASGWVPERFTTIPAERNPNDTYYLYNLLKQVDYVPTSHTIKIPTQYATDDLVDAYLVIGWDLVGM